MTIRRWIWKVMKFFAFRFDAEKVHELALLAFSFAIRVRSVPLRIMSGAERPRGKTTQSGAVVVSGMKFLSRVGLAAGFDKNAEVLEGVPALGFGFVEIGTVTPRPQPGNEKPRLFREASKNALFNRMGFNNEGAKNAADNLRKAKPRLPEGFRVGVNIGKNKTTPLEQAARDYGEAVKWFDGLADYLVINVSSPNTPGLRSLQSVEALKPIVGEVSQVITKWAQRPPLFLKLAPELKGQQLADLIIEIEKWGQIDGWVLTNTLAGTWNSSKGTLDGGWSGGPLQLCALESLKTARQISKKILVSVGGILTVEDALKRRSAGADLVQIYSGWIFNGPSFPVEVARGLSMT